MRNLLFKDFRWGVLILLFCFSFNLQAQEGGCPISISSLQTVTPPIICNGQNMDSLELEITILRENLIQAFVYDIVWFKGTTRLEDDRSKYAISNTFGTLTIYELSSSDAGEYTVQVSREGCEGTFTTQIIVEASSVPEVALISSIENCQNCFTAVIPSGYEDPTWSQNGVTTAANKFCTIQSGMVHFELTASSEGCDISKDTMVTAFSQPQITSLTGETSFCQGASTSLTAMVENANTFEWSLNGVALSSELIVTAESGGEYTFTASKEDGSCGVSETITVTEIISPTILDKSVTIKSGVAEAINLEIDSEAEVAFEVLESINTNEGNGFVFNQDNTITLSPSLSDDRAFGAVKYQVSATLKGCVGEPGLVTVKIAPDIETPFIPEIYSPNGDDVNDLWEVVFPNEEDADVHSVMIFNRSGGKVYERRNMNESWDGTNCPNGVYYYIITNSENQTTYKGAVTILGKK